MPLQRRVPKYGFKNINRKEYLVVNLDQLQNMIHAKRITGSVDLETFVANGIARKNDLIKILGRGELKTPLKVSAHKFSATAKKAIEVAGGEAITL